jgi:hypothetical protein
VAVHTIANVGAEEGGSRRTPLAAQRVARLWSLLFPRDAIALPASPPQGGPPIAFDPRLGAAERAAFRWIDDGAAWAWLNTPEAAGLAREAGVPLAGAPPEVVRQVHDKAFAHAVALAEGLLPRALRELVSVWSPEELLAGGALRDLEARVRAWPAWTRGRFCLKPRLGSSGRGRVPGDAASFDATALARALPRLARRGGALLEPWLERTGDLSAQLFVAPDGVVTLLGTLELCVTPSGVYRGHRGRLDHRLRLASGSPHDDGLLEAAMILARAAHARGFHGPCGIDAFAFRGPDGPLLRPAVELNARFTMGTIVAGLLRRARPHLRRRLPTPPGQLRALRFDLPARPVPDGEVAWELPLPEAGSRLVLGPAEGE